MISYEGRAFRRTDGDGALAFYRQIGYVVWAEVSGGPVARGALAGTCFADGTLSLAYALVLTTGEVVSGHTVNHPEVASDGRVMLREEWLRYGQHTACGVSYLEEVRAPVPVPTAGGAQQ